MKKGHWKNRVFAACCGLATVISVSLLLVLCVLVVQQGWSRLNWNLFRFMPSERPARAGIKLALIGSLWLIGLTSFISIPIGVATAVYLEEYAPANRLRKLIQLNISNLAGVPSIVYGILGLGLFVRAMALERSLLAGALTLSLVVLPAIILTAQESLRSVPDSIRNASFALGATRWQTVWYQVLPAATPGIMTGIILALSRAMGEAAPILVVGAVGTATFLPGSVHDRYSALPLLIFDWTGKPQKEFQLLAAAAIIVLMGVLMLLNLVAVVVRYRFSKQVRW